MSINIDVTIDLSAFEGKFDGKAADKAQQLLAERIMQDCYDFVPKDTGALRESGRIGDEGKSVEWTVDYAKYVYNFADVNFTTSGTCGHWFEAAKQEHLQDWTELVKGCFA